MQRQDRIPVILIPFDEAEYIAHSINSFVRKGTFLMETVRGVI